MTLILDKVSLDIDHHPILEEISFKQPLGQSLVVLGNSGAGKSKLLEVVAGLRRHQRGKISHAGRDLGPLSPQERRIGFVFQDYALFPHMTAAANILFGLQARRAPASEQGKWLKAVAAELKIDHLLQRFPGELSGGQQQRVALARCLVLRPEVLLLDEPLSALDAASRERLALLMKKIQQKYRVTMLYVTHDHNEARYMGDQVLVLDQGKVVQMGEPEEIFARPVSRFVAHFTATRNILPGRIRERCHDGLARLEFAGGELMAGSFPVSGDEVWVCLRPEHLSLAAGSEAKSRCSAETFSAERPWVNFISGYRIAQIIPQSGGTVLLELINRGERLLVFASNRRLEEQGLCLNVEVELKVGAQHVHCLLRQPDDIYCRPEQAVRISRNA
ncbi:MAG: ABC transporter ATP-binding protein [Deltaproteobacteria bacterium]|nr:ABC transporter ATP-binding protein [Deltaproteobacteria bacterium]